MVICGVRAGFLKESKASVELDEQVDRLVRCTHLRREIGEQHIDREVFRTVSKGMQHAWSKRVVLVSARGECQV